ncbi:transcription factor Rap1, putative [Trichophyton verrucosum HKI 0517]|uniref:DNA-binding protein RAP1 n=1 Tax=Trichophyton verrucosum (strain HKI 0517) TaxID=663202 RepID=D4DCB2_TRIVH|nr:transcription factor Rap1, putative [Trichophyton verrucosum HKI 0517]EFE40532.1 transcription factor Rap1, putative [Trichophyton verrucosum HKI 0517]
MDGSSAHPPGNDADTLQPSSPPLLFKDMKFWLSMTVPQRTHMRRQIEAHGGRVVILEKDADILLVDHLKRRTNPALGAPRGSVRQPTIGPAKRYRNPFTAEDDKTLYDWMERYKLAGGAVSGNKIYQQLEQQVPKAIFIYEREQILNFPFSIRTIHGPFTKADRDVLLENAEDILQVSPDAEDEMWSEFAKNEVCPRYHVSAPWFPNMAVFQSRHSATEWKNYFHTYVRPIHESKLRKKRQAMPRYSSISDTTKGSRGYTSAIDSRQTGGRGSDAQIPQAKRRRTLPDCFVSSDVNHTGADSRKDSSVELESTLSRSFSIGFSKSPVTLREESHRQHMNSKQQEIPPQSVVQNPRQSPHLVAEGTHNINAEQYNVEDEAEKVAEWIRSRVSRSRGVLSEEQVKMALRCTSLDRILADEVLKYFQAGKGIPLDMKGVWSEEDDAALQGVDPRNIARIEQKHGREEFDVRFEYLTDLSEALYGERHWTFQAYQTYTTSRDS